MAAPRNSQDPRTVAAEILSDGRYRPHVSDSGPLSWIGRHVRSVMSAIGRALNVVLPGSGVVETAGLVIAVVVVAGLAATVLIRRRSGIGTRSTAVAGAEPPFDRLADDAFAAGDYGRSVVLRFRGGIARLERGPRPAAPRRTNAVLAGTIPNNFPDLGLVFDAVRYGERPAGEADALEAKARWPKVVEEAAAVRVQPTAGTGNLSRTKGTSGTKRRRFTRR